MKISLNWLREFVEIPTDTDPHQLAKLFTIHTAEVEGIESQGEAMNKIVVGQIQEIHPHPDADKLRVTKTSIGKDTVQIVCGGSNLTEGMYVAVALPGSQVRWHGQGDLITLQETKIRGVESFGMICAGEEIGVDQPVGDPAIEGPNPILDLSGLKPAPGTPLAQVLGKDDIILTVDNKSLTHRPDLWGHYGVAREVAAITNKHFKAHKSEVTFPVASPESNIVGPSVEVKEKKLCPRYMGVKIENIRIQPSADWVKKRLHSAGYRSINNIVDATNYVMAEFGQPLHAFDAKKINTGIIVRTAKKDEKITTLDGVERTLPKETLVIADHEKPLAIAGIMGGANSEVDDTTTSILLEAANFQPSSIRKTSVKIGLRTEAVQRFEKSLDPHLAEQALHRVCEIILQVSPGATIAGPVTDIINFKTKVNTITLDIKKLCSKIGKEIAPEEIARLLHSIQFGAEIKGKKIKVTVPTFRPIKDIEIEDDIVEEVARLHGYDNIEPKLPELPIKLPLENRERVQKHILRKLISLGLGFNEVYNYSFYSLKDIQKTLLPEELHEKIENYLSEDQTHMRVTLVTNMLKNVVHNLKSFDHFKIYEIGHTYQDLQEYFPIEEKKICGMIVKPKKEGANVFYDAKGATETILNNLRIAGYEMRKGESLCPYAHPNKYSGYFLKKNGDELAKVFEIHPLVLKNFDLEKVSIGCFEINFTRLMQSADRSEMKYKSLPKFPGTTMDISILVDTQTTVGALQKAISSTDKQLIKNVELFDIYQGSNIPEGKKSLAFKVVIRADDRTLTEAEMKPVHEKILAAVQNLGGELRV